MNNVEKPRRLEAAKVVADSGRKQIQGEAFGQFAAGASGWLGSKWAFVGAIVIIVVWALTGPLFQYSDTWQLVINTGTTIITWGARLEVCQWRRETLDKESIWDEERSTSLSR